MKSILTFIKTNKVLVAVIFINILLFSYIIISTSMNKSKASKLIESEINKRTSLWDTIIKDKKNNIDSILRPVNEIRRNNKVTLSRISEIEKSQRELKKSLSKIKETYAKKSDYNSNTPFDTTNIILSRNLQRILPSEDSSK
jgi:hypothetical protein